MFKNFRFCLVLALVVLLGFTFAFGGGKNPPKKPHDGISINFSNSLWEAFELHNRYLKITEQLWIAQKEGEGEEVKEELVDQALSQLKAGREALENALSALEEMKDNASKPGFYELNRKLEERASIEIFAMAEKQGLLSVGPYNIIVQVSVKNATEGGVVGLLEVVGLTLSWTIADYDILMKAIEELRAAIVDNPIEAFQTEGLLRANYMANAAVQMTDIAYSGMTLLEHIVLGNISLDP